MLLFGKYINLSSVLVTGAKEALAFNLKVMFKYLNRKMQSKLRSPRPVQLIKNVILQIIKIIVLLIPVKEVLNTAEPSWTRFQSES